MINRSEDEKASQGGEVHNSVYSTIVQPLSMHDGVSHGRGAEGRMTTPTVALT